MKGPTYEERRGDHMWDLEEGEGSQKEEVVS